MTEFFSFKDISLRFYIDNENKLRIFKEVERTTIAGNTLTNFVELCYNGSKMHYYEQHQFYSIVDKLKHYKTFCLPHNNNGTITQIIDEEIRENFEKQSNEYLDNIYKNLKINEFPQAENVRKYEQFNTPAIKMASEIVSKLEMNNEVEYFRQISGFGDIKKDDVIPMKKEVEKKIKEVHFIEYKKLSGVIIYLIYYNDGSYKHYSILDDNFKEREKFELLYSKTLINEYFGQEIIKEVYEGYIGGVVKLPIYYKIAKRLIRSC